MEKQENRFLKQAEEELAYLSGDEDFKRLVEAREGFLRDQYEFELAGKKEGKKEATEQIAKDLLKLRVEMEKIIKATGLTKEEIEKLENDK